MEEMAKNRINQIHELAIDLIDKSAEKVKQDLLDTIFITEDFKVAKKKAAQIRLLVLIRKEIISQRDQELYKDD